MSIFRVGMKVVCVDDSEGAYGPEEKQIYKGSIYTVSAFRPGIGPSLIQLEEVDHTYLIGGVLCVGWFLAERFRPVVERKTDISIFQAMLTRPRLGVRA